MAAPATEYELALLVKDYLESKGFTKTASMFTRYEECFIFRGRLQ